MKEFSGTVSRLSNGKDYYFRVKAINESGLGDAQELMQAVTAKDEVFWDASDLKWNVTKAKNTPGCSN